MRIRNIKNKKEILNNCPILIKNPESCKENWYKEFKNNNPIYIEIGSGKCQFIKEMAIKYPNINFIGIERIDTVLAIGMRNISDYSKYSNLRFINYDANLLENVFSKEIEKIFLNFSDPWPKERHEKRRLTSSTLLNIYDKVFKNKGIIAFKTDNRELFEYSIKSFTDNNCLIKTVSLDLHNSKISDNILTEYEEKFIAKNMTIYFVEVYKK